MSPARWPISRGVPLARPDEGDDVAQHRRSALGALFGYVVGLSLGAAYGLVGSRARRPALPLRGALLGASAMAASDVPTTVLSMTNPPTWSGGQLAADIVPHAAYGLVTVGTFERITRAHLKRLGVDTTIRNVSLRLSRVDFVPGTSRGRSAAWPTRTLACPKNGTAECTGATT